MDKKEFDLIAFKIRRGRLVKKLEKAYNELKMYDQAHSLEKKNLIKEKAFP